MKRRIAQSAAWFFGFATLVLVALAARGVFQTRSGLEGLGDAFNALGLLIPAAVSLLLTFYTLDVASRSQ